MIILTKLLQEEGGFANRLGNKKSQKKYPIRIELAHDLRAALLR